MTKADLDYFASLGGVTACGMRREGEPVLSRRMGSENPGSQPDQLIATVVDGCLAVRAQGLKAKSLCWQFEAAWIFCGLRDDHSILVLITVSNPENAEQLREAVQRFAQSG